jgi:hypothetical protein
LALTRVLFRLPVFALVFRLAEPGWLNRVDRGRRSETGIFFVVSESDCTSELHAGQSNIFGAYEEKISHGFHEFPRIKFLLNAAVLSARRRRFMTARIRRDEICRSGPPEYPQRPHRKCKKAISGLFLVANGREVAFTGAA